MRYLPFYLKTECKILHFSFCLEVLLLSIVLSFSATLFTVYDGAKDNAAQYLSTSGIPLKVNIYNHKANDKIRDINWNAVDLYYQSGYTGQNTTIRNAAGDEFPLEIEEGGLSITKFAGVGVDFFKIPTPYFALINAMITKGEKISKDASEIGIWLSETIATEFGFSLGDKLYLGENAVAEFTVEGLFQQKSDAQFFVSYIFSAMRLDNGAIIERYFFDALQFYQFVTMCGQTQTEYMVDASIDALINGINHFRGVILSVAILFIIVFCALVLLFSFSSTSKVSHFLKLLQRLGAHAKSGYIVTFLRQFLLFFVVFVLSVGGMFAGAVYFSGVSETIFEIPFVFQPNATTLFILCISGLIGSLVTSVLTKMRIAIKMLNVKEVVE